MRPFRDRPIRQKLAIVTMLTTAAALLLAGAGIILADSVLFRGYLRRDLSTLARIVADNSTASLAFNDPDSAAQTLAALRARTHVAGACIYRSDGTVLATYSARSGFACPPPVMAQTVRSSRDQLTVSQPVVLSDGRRVGTLMLVYTLSEIGERVRLYGATVLCVLVAASLLAFLLSARLRTVVATPVSRLLRAADLVSETGDYGIRAQKLSGDELGVLVERFNAMLAGIQSRDTELRKVLLDREAALREIERERARFRFLAESMPQKIFTAAPGGESDYFNRQWTEFTGLSMEQIGKEGWTQFLHPDDLEDSIRAWRNCVAGGEPFLHEHRFRRADGIYLWHLTRAHPMRDAGGNITMWIGSSTDIAEQKEKEDELRRANEDLRQFAYSASHDLQEPIRNVAIYSEIIGRRYKDVLDADGQQYLGFLREGGRRLATLINDLLAYTMAGRTEIEPVPVSSSGVLQKAVANLSEAIRESGAAISSDPLPEVLMGAAHLQQVFQNLITNAMKYRDIAAPRIHISASAEGGSWRFAVRDNGIGIDPQYKETIFGVFKRLHHDEKYSGTGIGLAICQRVVERYGGRIWVESQPGAGATFYFTVPRYARTTLAVQSSAG